MRRTAYSQPGQIMEQSDCGLKDLRDGLPELGIPLIQILLILEESPLQGKIHAPGGQGALLAPPVAVVVNARDEIRILHHLLQSFLVHNSPTEDWNGPLSQSIGALFPEKTQFVPNGSKYELTGTVGVIQWENTPRG